MGGWSGAREFELICGRGHRCLVCFNSSMTCSCGMGALHAPAVVVFVVLMVAKVRKALLLFFPNTPWSYDP